MIVYQDNLILISYEASSLRLWLQTDSLQGYYYNLFCAENQVSN